MVVMPITTRLRWSLISGTIILTLMAIMTTAGTGIDGIEAGMPVTANRRLISYMNPESTLPVLDKA